RRRHTRWPRDWSSDVCSSDLRPLQLQGEGRKKKAAWWNVGRAAMGDAPVRWKEYHIEGLAPLPILRLIPRWLGLGLIFLASLLEIGRASCGKEWISGWLAKQE